MGFLLGKGGKNIDGKRFWYVAHRSAYGIRKDGNLVFAIGHHIGTKDLAKVLAHFRLAITVESHYLVGGLGSLVSEVVAERGLHCRLVRCGVRTTPKGISGSQSYLRQAHDLSSERLVEIALQTWHESKLETA